MNEGSSIEAAAHWVIALASGTFAVMLAVLAIAAVGFAMLAGRIDFRRASFVVFGCFLVFGASTIAAQLLGIAGSDQQSTAPPAGVFQPEVSIPQPKKVTPPPGYDPYAGAALPESH